MEPVPVLVVNEPPDLFKSDKLMSDVARKMGYTLVTQWYSQRKDIWKLIPMKSSEHPYVNSRDLSLFEGSRSEIAAFIKGFVTRDIIAAVSEKKLDQIKGLLK